MCSKYQTNDNRYLDFMPNQINNSIHLQTVSKDEIDKIIQNLSNKSSCGRDNISQNFIKLTKEQISPILTKLINLSISKKMYPACLKIAKIIPLHKASSKTECTNYRPISLLSGFNKIFERKIHNDLIEFIEKNEILYANQFGFRKFHSTVDALIKTQDHIIEERRKNNKVIGIFLDLYLTFLY